MNSEIHKKKIALLSKLLEEKAVTLEDCLLLLDEEEGIVKQPVLDPGRLFGPQRPLHTPWPNPYPGPAPYGGLNPIYINTTGTGSYPNPLNTISTNASL